MLHDLQKFQLTNKNIINWCDNIFISNVPQKTNKSFIQKKTLPKKDLPEKVENLSINHKDKLFWCFYIILNGEFNYNMITSHFSTEKQTKIDLISKVREKKGELKKYKFKINLIEDQLINEPIINIYTFLCLCKIFNLNVIINENKFYWDTDETDDETTDETADETAETYNIITINKYTAELYNGMDTTNIVVNIKDRCIKADRTKKIKSISKYKMEDLKKIIKKLNIHECFDNGKKKRKKELYTEILEYI
tara:strand:- start:160 stop:912 length:753 start_codon:yes stop_codon:yes gene_type:complete